MEASQTKSSKPILRVSVPQSCKACHKPTPTVCPKCEVFLPEADKDKFMTYYCSGQCIKEDWSRHASECKGLRNRGMLYRTGEFSHALFTLVRRASFNVAVARVEKDRDSKGRLIVREGDVE